MQLKNPKISVLVSARKNSKFLAKFISGYIANTSNQKDTEMLIMLNDEDTWNNELSEIYNDDFIFMREDYRLGRGGLHIYFNDLYKKAKGDWIIYFCEDHFITMRGWDNYVRSVILRKQLDPRAIYCLVPKFDNCGAMNQILSRGYIEALGGVLGRHGWIDSYINDLNKAAFEVETEDGESVIIENRVIRFDNEMFHDFTHDQPNPMHDSHLQAVVGPDADKLPTFDTDVVKELIRQDSIRLREKLMEGF